MGGGGSEEMCAGGRDEGVSRERIDTPKREKENTTLFNVVRGEV